MSDATGRRMRRDELSDWFRETPESQAEYEKAKRKLDAAWEVECRYGNCTIFVSADSSVREDLGGWGPIDCPCENPGWRWVKRNEDKPHRCPECHAIATWEMHGYGPRTKLKCPTGCRVIWRPGRRVNRQYAR